MKLRRSFYLRDRRELLSGPGLLARGLGITTELAGSGLIEGPIWIEDHGFSIDDASVMAGPRVGVDHAAEDASRPCRFRVRGACEIPSVVQGLPSEFSATQSA